MLNIEPLARFRFPQNSPSIYDEEVDTALQLAGKTAFKMNEVITYLDNTIEGVITDKIALKIESGFIDGTYNVGTETLVLSLKFPEEV